MDPSLFADSCYMPKVKPLTDEERAIISRMAAENPLPDMPKGRWVKPFNGGEVTFVPDPVIDISRYVVQGELDG